MFRNLIARIRRLFSRPTPSSIDQPKESSTPHESTFHELKIEREQHSTMLADVVWHINNDLNRYELIMIAKLVQNRLNALNTKR